eukprot:9585821-Alexandrium_andersonii.AAC.1
MGTDCRYARTRAPPASQPHATSPTHIQAALGLCRLHSVVNQPAGFIPVLPALLPEQALEGSTSVAP